MASSTQLQTKDGCTRKHFNPIFIFFIFINLYVLLIPNERCFLVSDEAEGPLAALSVEVALPVCSTWWHPLKSVASPPG